MILILNKIININKENIQRTLLPVTRRKLPFASEKATAKIKSSVWP